jgi:tetratricopeptide (TPR) repeat protein
MEEVLARLAAAVNAYLRGEDAAALRIERTLADIANLTKGMEPESLDLKAVYAAALVHWHRYHAAPDEEGSDDLAAAIRFFRPIMTTRPDLVPTQLHPLLMSDERNKRPARDPRIWAGRALRLLDRTVRSGEQEPLDEAIALLRRVREVAADDDPDRLGWLANLGSALSIRFKRVGTRADLDEAISNLTAVVEATPADAAHRSMDLSNLGSALRNRFDSTGSITDLNGAIDHLSAAVTTASDVDPQRPGYLSNLATALRARFEYTGALSDLNSAIDQLQAAVDIAPVDRPSRPVYLSNLGIALRSRFQQTGDPEDLNDAVERLRTALRETDRDDRPWVRHLFNLGTVLLVQFRDRNRPGDLHESIELLSKAVEVTPTDDPDCAGRLSTLGIALRIKFEHTQNVGDLTDALDRLNAAVEACSVHHPDRAQYLFNLGLALKARFEITRSSEDFHAAVTAWQRATKVEAASAEVRATAAYQWGDLAASIGRWDLALDGYAKAVALLSLLGWRGLDRTDQLHQLGRWADLTSDAAACAIIAGQQHRAVELLEQGRTVLWSQALETRTDVTALEEADPALAARIKQIRTTLDKVAWDGTDELVDRPPDPLGGISTFTSRAKQRMALTNEWHELIDQARKLPGLHEFLRTPEAAQVQQTATGGPIVIVNVSRYRCDALIVTPADIQVIPLPDLELDNTFEQTDRYLTTLHRLEQETGSADTLNELADAAEETTKATLEWLWGSVASPVLTALGYTDTPDGDDWPRVWWCPTGPLSLLPLHAAGYHSASPASGASVLNRVISSYTPTLGTLLRARQRSQPSSGRRRLLIVAPKAPGQADLPQAEFEAELLAERFPSDHTILRGPEATRERVLTDLSGHAWVHFACHGHQDLEHPSSGGLALEDGLLTIRDIALERLTNAEFAFLSACKTAIGGSRVPDEAIHLAAALHLVGYQHVIATLWSTFDRSTRAIAEHTYASLADPDRGLDLTHAAEALHHAIRRLRDRRPDNPTMWASYIHVGP